MFPSAAPAKKAGDKKKISKLFEKYAGGDDGDEPDLMYGEKLGQFFSDVGVDAEGAIGLGWAWQVCRVPLIDARHLVIVWVFGGSACVFMCVLREGVR